MKHGLQVKVSQCLTYSMVSDHILKTIFIIFGRWVSTEICSYLCSFFQRRMGRELARGLFRNHIFLNYLIRLECNPLAYKNTCWVIDDFAIFLSYYVLFLGLGFYTATLHCQLNHNKIDGTYVVHNQKAFHLRCFLFQENTKPLQKNNFKHLVLSISSRSLFLHIGQNK